MSTSTIETDLHIQPYFVLFHSPLAGTGQACGGHRVSAGQAGDRCRAGRGQALWASRRSQVRRPQHPELVTVFTFMGLEKAGKCLLALE